MYLFCCILVKVIYNFASHCVSVVVKITAAALELGAGARMEGGRGGGGGRGRSWKGLNKVHLALDKNTRILRWKIFTINDTERLCDPLRCFDALLTYGAAVTARGPDGCWGADALIEVFKDKRLELLLKYSQVLFLESSKSGVISGQVKSEGYKNATRVRVTTRVTN